MKTAKKILFWMTLLAAMIPLCMCAGATGEQNTLRLPGSLVTIQSEAFMYDTSLSRVIIPSGVKTIGERAFYGSSVTSVTIPDSVRTVGASAFANASSLQTVEASDTLLSRIDTASVFAGTPWLAKRNAISLGSGTNSIAVSSGQTVTGRYTARYSGTYVFYTTGSSDTLGYLYDENMVCLASNDDGGSDYNFRIAYDLVEGQTVYIGVRYYGSSMSGTISMTIEEPPVQLITAGSRTVSISADQTVSCRFTAQRAGSYSFYTTGSSDTYGTLYDINMTRLTYNDDGGESHNFLITYELAAGQTVYLGVRHYSETVSAAVTLVVEEPPLALCTGTNSFDVGAGVTVTGVYTAPRAGTYSFYTTGSSDTYGYLYDSGMTQLASNDDSGESNNFLIRYTLSAGQTVYVGVRYYGTSSSGTVTLNIDEPPVTLRAGSNSMDIAAGLTVKGVYTASRAGTYSFYTTGSSDTYGYLYDTDMTQLTSNDDGGSGMNFKITCSLSAGQTVYVGVRFFSGYSHGAVTLMVEEPEIVLQSGTNSIDIQSGQTTVCRFTASTAGSYDFYTTGTSDTYGYLYDANMTQLTDNDDGGDNTNFKITYTLSAGQTVYVGVRYYSSTTASGTVALVISPPVTVNYRALLIGQVSFSGDTCTRNRGDVELMADLLGTVNGGKYSVTKAIDKSKDEVRSLISTTFANATANDVSLILYASHGITNSGSYYGALSTYNKEYIKTNELASWLSEIPGKVIVLIGTCGSGAAIQASDLSTGEFEEFDPDVFDRSVIEAFAEMESASNSGELRTSKFYVMTASMGGESSWGSETRGYNYFVKWLYDGAGGTGTSMPADSNSNKQLTLNELYTYVKNQADQKEFTQDDGTKVKQHPMVYPENSSYVIFTK